jgi:dinuclear metal center YbgI/SA1388 family protein
MQYQQLTRQLDNLLQIPTWKDTDSSQNGLQVDPTHSDITHIGLAVDANQATFAAAAKIANLDLLIVHHGLFWGDSPLPVGIHYQRLQTLFQLGIGLYACHLPLDAHPQLGHNAQLAQRLGLTKLQPLDVGFVGDLPRPLTTTQFLTQLDLPPHHHYHLLPYGSAKIRRVAIISGGGGSPAALISARSSGADLYLTGEIGHLGSQYAQELKLNVLAAGHYWTETFGLQALGQHLAQTWSLTPTWLDAPTNF